MHEALIMSDICNIFINFIAAQTKCGRGYDLKDGTSCFGFIPSGNLASILNQLRKIRNQLHKETGRFPKFIDIGCGIGNITLIANAANYKTTGLEYDSKICKVARNLCKRTNIEIIEGDMRTFKNYHEYDVLYFYQPMKAYKDMLVFTVELTKQMKPGAYIICNGLSEAFEDSKDFYRVGKRGLWRKKPTKTEA
jgi:SAM-dependent methyltransferase